METCFKYLSLSLCVLSDILLLEIRKQLSALAKLMNAQIMIISLLKSLNLRALFLLLYSLLLFDGRC